MKRCVETTIKKKTSLCLSCRFVSGVPSVNADLLRKASLQKLLWHRGRGEAWKNSWKGYCERRDGPPIDGWIRSLSEFVSRTGFSG